MDVSPSSNFNERPFRFKVGTCNNGGRAGQNAVTIAPPMCTAKDGTQYAELSDPKKEVFILRLGKKTEGMSSKTKNVDLELCTPKLPEVKPPIPKCDRDTEYDPPPPEKAGKGKGKGKKGGKGGKKGKKK